MLAEWHLPPDYILNTWTEEKLEMMVEKLVERKKREAAAMRGRHYEPETHKISDSQLFAMAGIKVIKQ